MVRGKLEVGGGMSQTAGNDSPVVGMGSEKAEVFGGKCEGGVRSLSLVKAHLLTLSLALAAAISVGEENSAHRMESAQRGMAEASWPRKPDDRLSSLSGKMKENREISMRYFGEGKELRAKPAEGWRKEASLSQEVKWEGTTGRVWEGARWDQDRDWASGQSQNEMFQPDRELAKERTLTYREVEREPVAGWASRSSRLAASQEGSLRLYEGRLTRVRQRVGEEPGQGRELEGGRQETFRPSEVEKMLSEPVGENRGAAKAQSPTASPLAAADN